MLLVMVALIDVAVMVVLMVVKVAVTLD